MRTGKLLSGGIFCVGDQWLPVAMAEFLLFAQGTWQKGVEGNVWAAVKSCFLLQWGSAAKRNGLSGCLLGSAASSAVLSVLLGLALSTEVEPSSSLC